MKATTFGSSWKGAYVEGKDHDAKGNPIKQRFRAYDSMDEYAADKIQFLKRLYDFDENDDIDKFISKLSGTNKGKRRYAEATNYATSLANVYNKFAEGGIIKAQNGSKSEELLVKKALEFGQKTSEKMSPYDVRLIDFIKNKEGFRPKPEKDKTDGKWTVGYGLTDPKLIRKYRNGITEEEASKHLIQHLQMGADSLATMPYYDNLNLGEKTALNDLIYNVGWNKFKNSKRLQSHLRTGNDAGAKKEMNHGEHQARGLKIRRNQNRQMYDSTFSWKYKKGGVAKYQEPAQGINRIGRPVLADNSKDGGYNPSTLNSRQELLKKWDPTGGFDAASWIASKFFGNLANGEENEYYKTYLGLPSKIQPMKQGAQTNWDYLEEERKSKAKEQPSDFYGTTPRMDYNIQAIADTLNTGRIVRNYDVYKQKEPSLPDKEYVERIYNSGKQVMENPSKWVQVENGRAIKQGYDKQLEESDPLGMLGKFGMRWEPDQKALYVHDTYDFPWKARAATGIPVRPREMKIRGRISFDPNKGAVLLRDSLSGFNSKYPRPITDEE